MQAIQYDEANLPCKSEVSSIEYAARKIADRFRLQREVARVVAQLAGIGPQEGAVR